MANPVWVLSVDLQTKTATFQSGMADAARSARSAFKQINEGAGEMGGAVNRGSLDVRHALGLVDNTIRGAHSMAMVDLIRMFKDSALVMGALPFAMTVAGFALVAEMVVKGVQAFQEYRQAVERLRDDQTKMHTAIQDVFNGLDDKIIEAQKQTDELTGNHLAALRKELDLIDHTSLSDLRQAFDAIQKSADQTFGDLKASWYEMGIGSDGAKHALDEFATSYKSLLSVGNKKDASKLLAGTLETAQSVLALQNAAKADAAKWSGSTYLGGGADAYKKYIQDVNTLKQYGVGISDKEVKSQEALIGYLNAQVEVEQKVATLRKDQDSNARLQTAKEMTKDDNSRESRIAGGRARMMADLYANYQQQVSVVQEGERLVIDATKEGSAERLQAIEDAMKREEADGLQDTAFYKELALQKVAIERQLGEEIDQLRAQMGREEAQQEQRMGELKLAAARESLQSVRAQIVMSGAERIQAEMQIADEQYALEKKGLQDQLQALNQFATDYALKKQELNDKLLQLDQQHANQEQQLQNKAAQDEMSKFTSGQAQLLQIFNQGFAEVLTGKRSFAQMMQGIDNQLATSAIQGALKDIEATNMTREADAGKAARDAFKAGWKFPWPANIVAAPVMAAGAFAAAMAFEQGTDRVPGIGRGDIVPAMLEPGEGVVPGGVMDGLRNVARDGGFQQQGPTYHVSVNPRYTVHAVDAEGFRNVLEKHQDVLEKQFRKAVRKMNW